MTELIKHAIRYNFEQNTTIQIYVGSSEEAEFPYLAIVLDVEETTRKLSINCMLCQNKCKEVEKLTSVQCGEIGSKLKTDYTKKYEFENDGDKARLWVIYSPTTKMCARSYSKEEIANEEFIMYTDGEEYNRRESIQRAERKKAANRGKCVIM